MRHLVISILVLLPACTRPAREAPAEPEPEVAAVVAFTEGPTVDAEGNVYFTETRSERILKFTPGKGVTTFRENSNGANGLIIDPQGRLIACEGGARPRPRSRSPTASSSRRTTRRCTTSKATRPKEARA
jgi:gluconolactonase